MDSESIIKSTGDKLAAFTLITFDPLNTFVVSSRTRIILLPAFHARFHTRGGEYGVLNNRTVDEVSTTFHF